LLAERQRGALGLPIFFNLLVSDHLPDLEMNVNSKDLTLSRNDKNNVS